MMRMNVRRTISYACLGGLLLSGWGATAQQPDLDPALRNIKVELPPIADYYKRRFRLGVLVGFNIKADFKMSGTFNVSGHPPGVFDDGYVLDDDAVDDVYTSYWGYNNASQYNPSTGVLTMHEANSFTATSSSSEAADPQVGLEAVYGGNLWQWKKALIGWEFGFGWMPISVKDKSTVSTTFSRTAHTFDTAGIVMPEGPYNGGPSGIGPTIFAAETGQSQETTPGTIRGSRSVDLSFFTFKLGPAVHWELHRRVALELSGGAAMGYVTGDYVADEQILLSDGSTTQNRLKKGNSDIVFGGYFSALVLVHTVENADVYLGAQFMPLSSTTISGGAGREAELDLTGAIYLMAGINWPF